MPISRSTKGATPSPSRAPRKIASTGKKSRADYIQVSNDGREAIYSVGFLDSDGKLRLERVPDLENVGFDSRRAGNALADSPAKRPSSILGLHEAALIQRATEVIGDRSDAMRWLGTPVRALGYATPISLLHNAKGRTAVLTVLGRLEHGVL